MFCTNCGKSIPDDSVFCPECGAKLEIIEEQKENTVYPDEGVKEVQQETPIGETKGYHSEKESIEDEGTDPEAARAVVVGRGKKKRGIIGAISTVVVLLLIFVGRPLLRDGYYYHTYVPKIRDSKIIDGYDVTYGEGFDNYFDSLKWEAFETDGTTTADEETTRKGHKIVELNGKYTFEGTAHDVCMQYDVSTSDNEAIYFELDGETLGEEGYEEFILDVVLQYYGLDYMADTSAEESDLETSEAQTEALEAKESSVADMLPDDMPESFIFSSGAGGWGTYLYINEDGTFYGEYEESNAGDTGNGYENGTVYISDFSGEITDVKEVDEYTYILSISEIETEKADGKEWISDGVKYIACEPYGLEDTDSLVLYLEGRDTSDLKDDFLSWVYALGMYEEGDTNLEVSCLMNPVYQYGFVDGEAEGEYDDYYDDTYYDIITSELIYISDVSEITYDDIAYYYDLYSGDLTTSQWLTYARNEIYARHGYVFNADELNEYFYEEGRYEMDASFDGSLSELEQKNASTILEYQKEYGLEYTPK